MDPDASASGARLRLLPRRLFSHLPPRGVHAIGLSSIGCGAVAERVAVRDSRPTKRTTTVAPIATSRLVSRMFLSRLAAPPGATAYAATSDVRPIAAVARVPRPRRRNRWPRATGDIAPAER